MDVSLKEQLNGVPHRVVNPERIPAARYYDAEFFELERQKLWPHVWQMACRLEEIPVVGDYVEYRILEKSVIIVRCKNGVKAFHNACRHRGLQLVTEPGNCKTSGFICPFHGWRFDMEGKNTFVFGKQLFSERELAKAEIDLVPCRLETWGGCAFINFDDKAPSLLETLGPAADRLDARNAAMLKVESWHATILPTNWKLAMEAFMEGYHLMRTHPQLHALTFGIDDYGPVSAGSSPLRKLDGRKVVDLIIRFMDKNREGMGGMVHEREVAIAESLRDVEVPEAPEEAVGFFFSRLKDEIYKRGKAEGLPVTDMNKADAEFEFKPVEYLFPHFFLLPWFSSMSSYRIRPISPESCLFELWSLALVPEGEERPRVMGPITLPYDSDEFPEIPRQDYANLPRQQRGLHAGGFEYMRLSKEVEGTISNYQRLIDGFLAGLDSQSLLQATHVVNSGYNAPIRDIGF